VRSHHTRRYRRGSPRFAEQRTAAPSQPIEDVPAGHVAKVTQPRVARGHSWSEQQAN
jgi:hypothetical protein